MRKALQRKKQALWPEGKSAKILDIRAEGNMSLDMGNLEIASEWA